MSLSTLPIRNKLLVSRYVTNPATLLISLIDAKLYLNTGVGDEDAILTSMINAAVRTFESKTHRTLIDHNVETSYAATTLPLRLFKPPISAIVSITTEYEGVDSVEASTSDAYLYNKDGLAPEIRWNSDGGFTESNIQIIKVVTTNGFGTSVSDVPEDIIQAVRSIVSHYYDHRDEFEAGTLQTLPWDAQRTISDYEIPIL